MCESLRTRRAAPGQLLPPARRRMSARTGPANLRSAHLLNLGYLPVKEGVLIEDWPVQFVPTFAAVQEEAIARARRVEYGGTHTFIFSAEHLGAELLRSGRLKDQVRVIDLIESKKMDMNVFRDIISRHGLTEKWKGLITRY